MRKCIFFWIYDLKIAKSFRNIKIGFIRNFWTHRLLKKFCLTLDVRLFTFFYATDKQKLARANYRCFGDWCKNLCQGDCIYLHVHIFIKHKPKSSLTDLKRKLPKNHSPGEIPTDWNLSEKKLVKLGHNYLRHLTSFLELIVPVFNRKKPGMK